MGRFKDHEDNFARKFGAEKLGRAKHLFDLFSKLGRTRRIMKKIGEKLHEVTDLGPHKTTLN